jgi:hypothetical protein
MSSGERIKKKKIEHHPNMYVLHSSAVSFLYVIGVPTSEVPG